MVMGRRTGRTIVRVTRRGRQLAIVALVAVVGMLMGIGMHVRMVRTEGCGSLVRDDSSRAIMRRAQHGRSHHAPQRKQGRQHDEQQDADESHGAKRSRRMPRDIMKGNGRDCGPCHCWKVKREIAADRPSARP